MQKWWEKKPVNSIPTHKITTVNIPVYFFPLFCNAYFFHIIMIRWYTSACIYCVFMRALRNKPSETWTRALICLSSFLLPPVLPSFSWSSTPPPTKHEDNKALRNKSYQMRLGVAIILNCPSINVKLTALSPRLTQNKSTPQQRFNFILAKKVMNTNGDLALI